jgi:coproporphyrinogen III oxidase-like Fe-S oxidoreductase
VTDKIARLFFQSGVKTVRLGLETASVKLQEKTGRKTTNREYAKAVISLRNAGYHREEVGTYVMIGLPDQTPDDVEKSLDFVHRTGGSPHLSYFSPIPGTAIFKETCSVSPFPIEEEPLFQNNTIFILGNRAFSYKSLAYLKQKAAELRGHE